VTAYVDVHLGGRFSRKAQIDFCEPPKTSTGKIKKSNSANARDGRLRRP
jgi:hypothetical protein